MPPKRKEEKKHEEDLDISTLPQWISIFMMIEWESSLSEMASIFPIQQFVSISRSDLYSYAKEKNLIAANVTESNTPAMILARSLSEKVAMLDLQGRKNKRDILQKLEIQEKPRTESRQASALLTETSAQPIDTSKPDRIYLLMNFPKSSEEFFAIGKFSCNVHFYYYIKPENSPTVSNFSKVFHECILKTEKNSPLRTFCEKIICYDSSKYQGIELEMNKPEEIKLERNDTTQEAEGTKLRSGKMMLKKQTTKEIKEIREEGREMPQTPDVRKIFIGEVLKNISEASQSYIKYLVWKEITTLKPLFPSNVALDNSDSGSYTNGSVVADIGKVQDLPSLDDSPKPWDFRVFDYLFAQHEDFSADLTYFFACVLQQLTYSEQYLTNLCFSHKSNPSLICGADILHQKSKLINFINTEGKDYYKKIYDSYVLPVTDHNGPKEISNLEMSYFLTIDSQELERMILISQFEDLISKHTGKPCELNREYSEKIPKSMLNFNLMKISAYNPEILMSVLHNGIILLAIFYDSSSIAASSWEHTRKIRPLFQDWKESNIYPSEFYDIDEYKIGVIKSAEQSYFPNNGSVLRYYTFNVNHKVFKRCFVVAKDKIFGISNDGNDWWYYCEKFRLVGTNSELTYCGNGILIRCGKDVLQELTSFNMNERVVNGGAKEVKRVITGKGTVIRYLHDKTIQILFANGNISDYNGKWIVTNNKGIRTCKGKILDEVPCAWITDPKTNIKTVMREDGTLIIYYNNKTVAEFQDGTKILTTDEYWLIESPMYAPVKIDRQSQKYQVLLANGYQISNHNGVKIENHSQKIVYDCNQAFIDDYIINMDHHTISITDDINNFYQIGLFSEPRQIVLQKNHKFISDPILYIVDPNGDAFELLGTSQIVSKTEGTHFIRFPAFIEGMDTECYLIKDRKSSHDKGHLDSEFLNEYKYPEILNTIKPQDPFLSDDPGQWWVYRVFLKYPEFNHSKRLLFNDSLHKYLAWKRTVSNRKEFGTSEFSQLTFEIRRKMLLQKQKPLKSCPSSHHELKNVLENFLSAYIINSERNSLQSSLKNLEPTFSPNSPKPVKTRHQRNFHSSTDSTLPSVNYFKSPEGLDLSLNSSVSQKSPIVTVKKTSRKQASLQIDPIQDSPIISLEPYVGKKVRLRSVVRSSVFAQVEKLQELKEISEKQISEEYYAVKTKDFNVYGSARKSVPVVQSLRSTSPVSRLNNKYLATEAFIDNRVKTISQTKKPMFKAPNAITYRRSSNPSIFKVSMLSEYVNDPNRHVLEITPSVLDLGNVLIGKIISQKIILKNEETGLVRFNVKQPDNNDVKVVFRPGPIAPGMITKLIVEVNAREIGEIKTAFEVYCKSEIFTIPICAHVVSDESLVKSDKIKGLVEKVRGNKLPSLNKTNVF